MSLKKISWVRHESDRGQALVLIPLLLVVLLSFAAFVLDLGNVYVSYQQLQSATNSAALAGGAAIPAGTASATAYQYSGSTSNGALYNIHPSLNITSVTPSLACVQPTTYPNLGLPPCATYSSAQGSVNVIQVKETASVPTYFAKIFGVRTVPIAATATASAKGGGAPPYNIMLVMDTTASMGSGSDTGCVTGKSGTYTPIQCAEYGVQTLLSELDPCATTLSTCGAASNGLTSTAVDEVGLMVFPGLTPTQTTNLTNTTSGATANAEYDCSTGSNPSITSYNNNPQYLILPFQNDFRTSDTAQLNQGSNLFKSVGVGVGTGKNACGMQTPGGEGTFYAGAIIAAQAYLAANSRTGAKNVMILLSDGDATANATEMGGKTQQTVSIAGMSNGLFSSTAECTQAVAAATYAKDAGTQIYSISYGSGSTGCNTGSETYKTPCATMQGIASVPLSQYFFSVPQTVSGKTSTVCPGAVPITQLSQVFTTIAGDLTTSRLVPNLVF